MVKSALVLIVISPLLMGAICQEKEIRYAPMRCMEASKPELEALPAVPDCEEAEPGEECLYDETWFRIKDRDTDLRHYADKLKASCDTLDRLATQAEED